MAEICFTRNFRTLFFFSVVNFGLDLHNPKTKSLGFRFKPKASVAVFCTETRKLENFGALTTLLLSIPQPSLTTGLLSVKSDILFECKPVFRIPSLT